MSISEFISSRESKQHLPPEDKAYIMVLGRPVLVDEIFKESAFLRRFFSYKGEIPVNIKSHSLIMALHFCVKLANIDDANKNHSVIWDMGFEFGFNDAFDLLHAASWLGIQSLYDQLFHSVVYHIDDSSDTEIAKKFYVRYNKEDPERLSWMKYVLDCAPKAETNFDHQKILTASVNEFKDDLSYPEKHYWVYAHLVILRNIAVFIMAEQLSAVETYLHGMISLRRRQRHRDRDRDRGWDRDRDRDRDWGWAWDLDEDDDRYWDQYWGRDKDEDGNKKRFNDLMKDIQDAREKH